MVVEAADASVKEPIIQAIVDAGYGASLAGERKQAEATADTGLQEMKKRARISYQPYSMTECAAKYEALFNEEH